MLELNNQNIILSLNEIIRKFDAKLCKYWKQKDILSILVFDYIDTSLMILYLVVLRIIISKIR